MNDQTRNSDGGHPDGEPWQWSEATWRRIVGRARAGRSLRPKSWPVGARCAVAISFDADHETIPLRDADESPMRISQGQYGNRQAMPRIRDLLQKEAIPASFFYPAVSALLHPDEVRGVADDGHEIGIHSWIHEANTTLPRAAERDLTFRAAETLGRIAGRDPVGMRTASWDFSVNTLDIVRELGVGPWSAGRRRTRGECGGQSGEWDECGGGVRRTGTSTEAGCGERERRGENA